jgi:peptidoglycan hydrolase CwlO-like protein
MIELILADLKAVRDAINVVKANTPVHLGDALLGISRAEKKVKDLGSMMEEAIKQLDDVETELQMSEPRLDEVEDQVAKTKEGLLKLTEIGG